MHVIVRLDQRPRTLYVIGFAALSIQEVRGRRGDRLIGRYHAAPPVGVPVYYHLRPGTLGLVVRAKTLIDPARDVTVALVPAPGATTRIGLPTAEPRPTLLAELTDLFASVPWTYAKTYHEKAPHFWCKKSQFPDPETFARVCQSIPTHGYRHKHPNAPGGSWWQAIDVPPRMVWTGWALPQHHGLVNSRPLVWAGRPAVPLYAEQTLVVDGAVQVPLEELLHLLPEVP